MHQNTPTFLARISHIDLKSNPMVYKTQYCSQYGSEKGYLSVLLFLGQRGDCISSWHILEYLNRKFYLASPGTESYSLLSNTPRSNLFSIS